MVRCIQVGLLCVQDRANDRPDMHSVVLMLESEKCKALSAECAIVYNGGKPSDTQIAANTDESFSVNDVTITELFWGDEGS